MSTDLHFSAAIFGLGAGIFFVGYVLFQIPISISAETKSTRKVIALLMLASGIVALITSLINSDWQFYLVRFALGACMAGIFPALIVYSSHWFRARERATVFSILIAATAFSQIIAGPISTQILTINWYGLEGWRWVFILEAIPAIVMAPIIYFFLTDRPKQAKWLTADQIKRLEYDFEIENRAKIQTNGYTWKQASRDREVIKLIIVYTLWLAAAYGLLFFVPTIISELGFTTMTVGVIVAILSTVGFASLILVGISSDRKNERKLHTVIPLIVAAAALGLSIFVSTNIVMTIVLLAIAICGIGSAFGIFWTFPTLFLSKKSAAVSVGLIAAVGNIGGFFGPTIAGLLKSSSGSFVIPSLFLLIMVGITVSLILSLRSTKLAYSKLS